MAAEAETVEDLPKHDLATYRSMKNNQSKTERLNDWATTEVEKQEDKTENYNRCVFW